MVLPRNQLGRRRLRRLAALIGVCAAVGWWVWWMEGALHRSAYATGYAMLGVIVTLAAYGVRKKLPGLPLASSSAWLQLHLYLGVGSAVLFAIHAGWTRHGIHWPNGWLEGSLAAAYLATFTSGVWGLWLSRAVPRQLARTSDQIIFERVPLLRRGLLMRSRQAVLAAVDASGAVTLAGFYADRIDPYLAAPRGLGYVLRPSGRLRRTLLTELSDLKRLLTDAELTASEQLFALLRRKDDIDFHQARQGLLKAWLFAHVTLTWALLLLGVLHGIMALSMQGGSMQGGSVLGGSVQAAAVAAAALADGGAGGIR